MQRNFILQKIIYSHTNKLIKKQKDKESCSPNFVLSFFRRQYAECLFHCPYLAPLVAESLFPYCLMPLHKNAHKKIIWAKIWNIPYVLFTPP